MVILIHGYGAHGKDIASDLTGKGREVVWCDDPNTGFIGHYDRVVVGVNNGHTRQDIAERKGYDRGQWVHNDASVGPDVHLGQHTHVNAGAFLTRCTLGDFCTVGPNATICGDVTIGNLVTIGAGAVIRNLLTICDDVTIGCGAVVVKDITEPGTYVGNPARPIEWRDPGEVARELADLEAKRAGL